MSDRIITDLQVAALLAYIDAMEHFLEAADELLLQDSPEPLHDELRRGLRSLPKIDLKRLVRVASGHSNKDEILTLSKEEVLAVIDVMKACMEDGTFFDSAVEMMRK